MRIDISKKNSLVYIAYIMMNLYYGLTETILSFNGITMILLGAIGLTTIHILLSHKHDTKKMLLTLVLIGIFGYNYYKTGDSRILTLIVMIFGIKDLELENVLKVTFYEKIILTLMVMVASFASSGGYYIGRAVLGFSHGNLLMLSITTMILMYLCLYWKKVNGSTFLLLIAIIFIAYKVTGSRSGLVTSIIIWLMAFSYKYFRTKHILEFIGKYIPFVLMFLSIYMPLSMTNNLFIVMDKIPGFVTKYNTMVDWINRLLTNRFTFSNIALKNTDINWLGSVSDMGKLSKYSYFVVDSGYVQLLLVFGILGSIIFMVLNYMMTKEVIKRQQHVYLIAIIAMALYAFTENSWCSLKYNFTLLFLIQMYRPIKAQFSEYVKKKRKKVVLFRRR